MASAWALLLSGGLMLVCTSGSGNAPAGGCEPREVAQAPPPLGIMPPNASRIKAKVLKDTVWPPGSLTGTRPAVRPNRTLYSLTLDIQTSAPVQRDLSSVAQPGSVIEAFSFDVLPAGLTGQTIEAVVQLTGDTMGMRWQISNIRALE
jgi:hypothetical protein